MRHKQHYGVIGEVDVAEQFVTLFVLCWSEIYQTAGEVCVLKRVKRRAC